MDPKKKSFANTHYPGIKADPNEGMLGVPKEALEFLKPQMERIGMEKQRRIWGNSVLLLGGGKDALPVAESLGRAGIHKIGALSLLGGSDARDSLRALAAALRAKYAWVEFEPFAGLSLDRDALGVLRGFRFMVDCSDGAYEGQGSLEELRQAEKVLGTLSLRSGAFRSLPEESLLDWLSH